MTATDTGLLHAILERPHDDTARLIYADWLDDQGDLFLTRPNFNGLSEFQGTGPLK